jgi:hypothetical protein
VKAEITSTMQNSTSTTRSAICVIEALFFRHHFTGKERDAESGNDYFEARYYRRVAHPEELGRPILRFFLAKGGFHESHSGRWRAGRWPGH